MLLTDGRSSSSVVWCLSNFAVDISVLGIEEWMWLFFFHCRMRQATCGLKKWPLTLTLTFKAKANIVFFISPLLQ